MYCSKNVPSKGRSQMNTYDAIIIGAGHNGLSCATALARRGKKILVVEAQDQIGGLAAMREFADGYRTPGILHDTSEIRVSLLDHLGLYAEGLQLSPQFDPVYVPTAEGDGFFLSGDSAQTIEALKEHSPEDADAFKDWCDVIERFRAVIQKTTNQIPPPLIPDSPSEFLNMGKLGLSVRMLGSNDMMELVRVLPMCAADWLQEYFKSEALCAALAGPALTGSYMGPWSAGSAALVLLRHCNLTPGIVGGPAALINALESAFKKAGGTIETGTPVERITVEDDKVTGVMTSDGTKVSAPIVISGCDPVHTVMDLCHPADLTMAFEDEIKNVRTRGTTAKVHLALSDQLPLQVAGQNNTPSRIRIGSSIDELERAFDAVKYRTFSEVPQLDVWLPSMDCPDLAPDGHHVASIMVNYAPYQLDAEWSEATKEQLLDNVVKRLEEIAPGTKDRILHSEVLTPKDLSEEFALTGGHMYHAEHALDQLLFMRPVASAAHYETPLSGLFFCSSGCHPGGGITCAPGALAAQTVLGKL
jgi:phytoene dehydrogenase-like protein